MKQQPWLLCQLRTLLFFSALLFCSHNAFSANIFAGSGGTVLIPGSNFSSVSTLNCDMIDVRGNGKLTAVVFDGFNLTSGMQECGLLVNFNGTPAYTGTVDLISNNGQYINPDVAIIDLSSGTWGEDYRIMVSVENTFTNQIEIWEATITGVGLSPSYTSIVGRRVITNTTGSPMYNPHIDAAADVTFLINLDHYGSDDFVVSWEEPSGTLPGIWASPYNYQTGLTLNNPTQIFAGFAQWADVACRGHYTLSPLTPSPTYTAYFSFVDATSGLINVASLTSDKSGAVFSAGGAVPISSGVGTKPTYGYPRIEARKLADINPTLTTWEVVADADPGSGFYEIHTFNDVAGQTNLSFSSTSNHYRPVVTGVGQEVEYLGSPNFGCKAFTVSYYTDDVTPFSTTNGDYISNFVSMNGGGLLNPDYYQVENAGLNQMFSYTQPCIAASTSSNTGDDVLTVYFDGFNGTFGDIRYKLWSSNTPNYKTGTTGIVNVNKKKGYALSPNPASNTINVNGAANADYRIMDAIGKTVSTGTVGSNANSINISQLATGTYTITLTENGYTQNIRFAKQ